MNFKSATKEQLQQIALNEDCDISDKYKACKQIQIKFTISKYRKLPSVKSFNPRLSRYWYDSLESMFKGWK